MKSFFLVIRLDFVPFGYFLALSLSFLRSYTLLKRVHYRGVTQKV